MENSNANEKLQAKVQTKKCKRKSANEKVKSASEKVHNQLLCLYAVNAKCFQARSDILKNKSISLHKMDGLWRRHCLTT